ncbi:flagellar basal body L-ring protein FlgH [Campylobacterota bacterium]
MNKIHLTILLTLTAFTGCSQHVVDPEIDFKPPEYVEQLPEKETHENMDSQGSLFGQGDNPLFSDHKAMHVHDLVTVVISEAATSSSSNSKKFSASDKSSLEGGTFGSTGGSETMDKLANKLNRVGNISFSGDSTSSFDGSGEASVNNRFTTTVSARVIKILSNGNYFISGRREILIDGEKQIIQLSGVIRPFDINQNNQVNSAQMADAKILYKTEGDIKRATEQGWGIKLVQALWPF